MSKAEVVGQLEQYGSWLEEEMGVLLSPPLKAEVRAGEDDLVATARILEAEAVVEFGPRRSRLLVGIAAGLAIAVLGFAFFSSIASTDDSEFDPADLDKVQLPFVLPPDGYESLQIVGALETYERRHSDYLARTTLLGVFDGVSYTSRISLSVINSEPAVGADQVSELRGTVWLVISAPEMDASSSEELLRIIEIESDGFASMPLEYGYEEIARFLEGSVIKVTQTVLFPVADDLLSTGVWVETSNEHPLVNVELRGGELTSIEVRGVRGWRLYLPGLRDYLDRYWIAWQTEAGGMVSVSGSAEYGEVLAIANELIFTDEQTWTAGYSEPPFGRSGANPYVARENLLRLQLDTRGPQSLCNVLRPSLDRNRIDEELGFPSSVPKPVGEAIGYGSRCSSSPGAVEADVAIFYSNGVLLLTNHPDSARPNFDSLLEEDEFQNETPRQIAEGVYVVGELQFTGEFVDIAVLYQQSQSE